MKKRINDIFYSLQGEGRHSGRAALFVRFAGCNLRCPFCDTDFDSYHEWSDDCIVTELLARCMDHGVRCGQLPMVVLTGGEPTLQADEAFVDLLRGEGFYVAMESNGLLPAPRNLDWLTVSPKAVGPGAGASADSRGAGARMPDEVKMVWDGEHDPEKMLAAYARRMAFGKAWKPLLYVQPCDTGNTAQNAILTAACVRYVMTHPQWRLSLQTHKLIGIE